MPPDILHWSVAAKAINNRRLRKEKARAKKANTKAEQQDEYMVVLNKSWRVLKEIRRSRVSLARSAMRWGIATTIAARNSTRIFFLANVDKSGLQSRF